MPAGAAIFLLDIAMAILDAGAGKGHGDEP